jgi:hypothetical protein
MVKKLNEVFLRIVPGKFHFLKFILEGYDNLAILSSFQSSEGIVVIRYPQELAQDLFGLLGSIGNYLSQPTPGKLGKKPRQVP